MLSAEAKALLQERRRKRCSDYVFPSPFDPSRPLASIAGAWATIKRLADLPETLRPHELRHTYASHAVLSGESLYVTGNTHSTERYAHLDGRALAKAADKVGAKIEQTGVNAGPPTPLSG